MPYIHDIFYGCIEAKTMEPHGQTWGPGKTPGFVLGYAVVIRLIIKVTSAVAIHSSIVFCMHPGATLWYTAKAD